jgi:VCBS repeat-containing protein
VATNDTFSTDEDVTLVVLAPGVLGNDTDADGDSLVAIVVSNPTNGTLILNGNGSFSYTPNANFNGTDNFTYKANDGAADSNVATATITVNAVNDAPAANNDAYTTDFNTTLTVNAALGVLSNDTDADGNVLTAILETSTSNGTLTFNADGSFTYTPNGGFSGADSFSYKANDGTADSNVATVTINVGAAPNVAPVANDDAYATNEDTPLPVAAPGVLGNDTDANGDPLVATLGSAPTNGVLVFNSDGSFTYTPNANFNGADGFSYTASDGRGGSDTATVTITVNAVNDAPVANNDSATTNQDVAVTVNVLANDSDPDGDTLTISGLTPGANGSTSLTMGGVLYTPNAGFSGVDSFSYTVSDGNGGSATAQVTVTVNPTTPPPCNPNHPENCPPPANRNPLAVNDSATTTQEVAVTINVLGNDSDPDGDPLTVSSVTPGANGSASIVAGGVLYTPNAGFTGSDSFSYTISDGRGGTATAQVTVTVNPAGGPHDPPTDPPPPGPHDDIGQIP